MTIVRRLVLAGAAGAGVLLVALLIFSNSGSSGPSSTLALQAGGQSQAVQPAPQTAPGNGDGTITQGAAPQLSAASFVSGGVFSGTVDHAAAGTGARSTGYGNIRLRGVPAGSTVVKAYLYSGIICATSPCPASQTVNFDERRFGATLIATGAQPCWGAATGFGAYRSDVTARVPKDINGDYEVDGIGTAVTDGSDPWITVTATLPKAEGATLVVIYSNPALSPGVVYLHHGAVFIGGGTTTISNALAPALPGTSLKSTRFGADGQVFSSTSATPGTSDEGTFIGATGGGLTQIMGNGSAFNQDSDWNGNDGGPLNQLWDTHTSTVPGVIPAGSASYDVSYVAPADCMDVVGHVLTSR